MDDLKEKYVNIIINFINIYKYDMHHDEVWLRSQIKNQLNHFKDDIIMKKNNEIIWVNS